MKNINEAIQEIMHAQSALNMEPRPLPESEGSYLSETDYWVKHAYEHLNKAIQVLNKAATDYWEKHADEHLNKAIQVFNNTIEPDSALDDPISRKGITHPNETDLPF